MDRDWEGRGKKRDRGRWEKKLGQKFGKRRGKGRDRLKHGEKKSKEKRG